MAFKLFSFKMVTAQPETADTMTQEDTGTTFSKLRQLMTVTGNGEWIFVVERKNIAFVLLYYLCYF